MSISEIEMETVLLFFECLLTRNAFESFWVELSQLTHSQTKKKHYLSFRDLWLKQTLKLFMCDFTVGFIRLKCSYNWIICFLSFSFFLSLCVILLVFLYPQYFQCSITDFFYRMKCTLRSLVSLNLNSFSILFNNIFIYIPLKSWYHLLFNVMEFIFANFLFILL